MARKNKNTVTPAEEQAPAAPAPEAAVAAPETVNVSQDSQDVKEGEAVTEPAQDQSEPVAPEGEPVAGEGEPAQPPEDQKADNQEEPVLDDDEEMMEEQATDSAPRAGKKITALKLKKFKIRHRSWNRRSPLRVVKPFEYDGQSFEVGTVFDWAKAGYKPASVQRLFSRGVVRHVVQDGGILYPFREVQEPVKKKRKDGVVRGYDFLQKEKSSESVPEVELTEEQRLELNRVKHGIGNVAEDDVPKNFSIKGSHKQ